MKIGLVGIGRMGGAIARKLLEAGQEVWGIDIEPQARQRGVTWGIRWLAGLEELRGVEVVLLSLPGPWEVEDVVTGEPGLISILPKGSVVVDLSTIDSATSKKMAMAAAKVEMSFLDSPVLGRPESVGKWVLPVGGNPAALEVCRPVLDLLAVRIVSVGDSGSGSALKLLNNLMFGAINNVTAEVMSVASRFGLTPKTLYELIANSEAATVSPLFKQSARKIVDRDYEPIFSIDLLTKDNDLGLKMAREVQFPLLLGSTIDLLNKLAKIKGYGKEDTAALVKVYQDLYQTSV